MTSIGQFIRTRRKELGITASELSRRLGISVAAVSNWEMNPSRAPSKPYLQPIADALQVSVDDLLNATSAKPGQLALSPDELEILDLYRCQGTLERALILRMLRGLRANKAKAIK
ncbi:helix-turn-helix transcriptional regulator [Methylococcaceae bacterium WWC4]|nr:helix-turn-helix transcriptional regulator [Methylococcaceae bacterium WWC4]